MEKIQNTDNRQNTDTEQFVPQYIPGPTALVYKTKNDYYNLVPVILSDDKTEIISYPHPSDLKIGNEYPLPTRLNNGYLLDNRGIGKHVAFLKITYQEYTKLNEAPSLKELYKEILDKEPLVELYNCGNKDAFNDIVKQLNELIISNKLSTVFKVIK